MRISFLETKAGVLCGCTVSKRDSGGLQLAPRDHDAGRGSASTESTPDAHRAAFGYAGSAVVLRRWAAIQRPARLTPRSRSNQARELLRHRQPRLRCINVRPKLTLCNRAAVGFRVASARVHFTSWKTETGAAGRRDRVFYSPGAFEYRLIFQNTLDPAPR
jgi:hypothetical protein